MSGKRAKRIGTWLIVGLLTVMLAMPMLSMAWTPDQKGTVTVTYTDKKTGAPVGGIPVTLYKVAEMDEDSHMQWTEQTRNLNLTLPQKGVGAWDNLAKDLQTRVAADWIKIGPKSTGTDGKLVFEDLAPGVYLGIIETTKIGNKIYSASPFLTAVPYRPDTMSSWNFNVDVLPKPKVDEESTPPGSKTTSYAVEKVWQDVGFEADRPKKIRVQLYRGTKPYGDPKVLTEENEWKASWSGLPTPKSQYSVREIIDEENKEAMSGYITGTAPSSKKEFDCVITNTKRSQTPKTKEVSVKKVWLDSDDQDQLRPADITVQLYQRAGDDTSVTAYGEPVTLNEANGWAYRWSDLPEDSTWSVEEVRVPEGYKCEVTLDGTVFTLRNTHTPENPSMAKVSVKKVWSDSNDSAKKRPAEVSVQLYKLAETTGEKTPQGDAVKLNKDNGWAYEWKDLPELPKGESWTVEETAVPAGYTAKVTATNLDFTVTNTYTPPTTPPGTTTKKTKLPQTGQLWWPVPVLAGAGVLLILAGLFYRRTGRGENE